MAASFIVNGSNTTIRLEYTSTTTNIQSIVGDAAHYLWKDELDAEGNITNPFDQATNQQKLDVVFNHIKDVIVNEANTYKSISAQDAARATAEATKYSL